MSPFFLCLLLMILLTSISGVDVVNKNGKYYVDCHVYENVNGVSTSSDGKNVKVTVHYKNGTIEMMEYDYDPDCQLPENVKPEPVTFPPGFPFDGTPLVIPPIPPMQPIPPIPPMQPLPPLPPIPPIQFPNAFPFNGAQLNIPSLSWLNIRVPYFNMRGKK